jgi:ribonuclease E
MDDNKESLSVRGDRPVHESRVEEVPGPDDDDDEADDGEARAETEAEAGDEGSSQRRRSRRRGRRGGRQHRNGRPGEPGSPREIGADNAGSSEDSEVALTAGAETDTVAPRQQPEYASAEAPATSSQIRGDAEPNLPEAAPSTNAATFRESQRREDSYAASSNGVSQPNGRDHAAERSEESGAESLAVSHEANAELEAEAGPPEAAKPRGSKRGWWQRRVE